ncbi:hypothetical protein MMC25_000460, partial [Agyrium rufum]|nr:hypothetical protein [Agyrium rufum]
TWVPLESGRMLAERNGVFEKLRPLFDFVHHDRDKTPPQAPKHTTAASSKPRMPKAAPMKKAPKLTHPKRDDFYERSSQITLDDNTDDNSTVVSESIIEEDDLLQPANLNSSKKRKRVVGEEDVNHKNEKDHQNYADALLDYFMLNDNNSPFQKQDPPTPPFPFQANRPIDSQNHTPLHWAAAMGEPDIIVDLIRLGAQLGARNVRGETPLMRAGSFANCYEKGIFPKIVKILLPTITQQDDFGGTILHHICQSANSASKTERARHYLNVIFNDLSDIPPQTASDFLNLQDHNGDTAFHIAARNSKRCVRAFQGTGAASDIENHECETVDQILKARATAKSSQKSDFMLSSSPVQPGDLMHHSGTIPLPKRPNGLSSFTTEKLRTPSARALSESFGQVETRMHEMLQDMEAQHAEKDKTLADANALLKSLEVERSGVREQTFRLAAEAEDTHVLELRADLAKLQEETIALEEQAQHAHLHAALRAAESKAKQSHANGILSPPSSTNTSITLSDSLDNTPSSITIDGSMRMRIQTALVLAREQALRRDLTLGVCKARADAGFSERGDMLKRVVASSLNMPTEEVVKNVDEILEELNADALCSARFLDQVV